MKYDLVLKGGTLFTPGGLVAKDIAIKRGKIAAIGDFHKDQTEELLHCEGLTILPGAIDTQVHFREPGHETKEDLASGSKAAVLGGITAVFEMPNTNPPTDTVEALVDKLARAHHRMWCDHAFYIGATLGNKDQLAALEQLPGCAGIKIFMGSSTGNLLVDDDDTLLSILQSGRRRIAIHAEDEARLKERKKYCVPGDPASHPVWRDDETAILATRRILSLARKTGRLIHILHVTTPEEMALIAAHKDIASCELTPQHLTLSAETAYPTLGSYAQMNPPIRSEKHRLGLWHCLQQGIADVIGSDHAPHTIEDKHHPYPQSPSGMPGVQTLLPLMLNHVSEGHLSLSRLVDLVSAGPQRLFGLLEKGRIAVGYDADFSVVDLKASWIIKDEWLASKCGWSPFLGNTLKGLPVGTIIRGNKVMWEGHLYGEPVGQPLRFQDSLRTELLE
ncbi:MAG: dihydroorotase [Zymomonas mobilis subsp. pomaceae]|uniref:Dihydroorotase, multifunctional complex type n=1 Tax=Zymomonas mobilis subsp. pomaceae (strain ATCC 29192 / DSM 22645 / JCM 10191 / CCUG 17912 / NBRC 13757 / NCIMB 11200 / NRRL B-4491 / Barker I) TaxID=579138 RepID=F8EVA0_ZYMMT|nr:dihydroorotase [Zymomonas mobilis]AEI38318.1 dihydroorotase, multifunctional complex type [Zymomonas mobilis subsp. pomaceae ATCC 29192]MDX5948007.1 dihydroorotase [Zymomonas mobilis subsp. pomaceae]GEB89337.1 dihydroorotase [Zymomonas mobilis subsp. pomaceae]